jgi:hypothetical protein
MSKSKVTPEEYWEGSKAKTIALAKLEGRKLKSYEIVYETIDRWCLKDKAAAEEKVNLMLGNSSIKKEITDAARSVQNGTHEQVNASSQAKFLISVAVGKQISTSGRVFEKTSKLKDGSVASVTRIAKDQRLPTVELMTAPVKASSIKNVAKRLSDSEEEDLSVMTGHVGAMSFNEEGTKASSSDQVVSKAGSSSGKDGVHVAQLKAQLESSHHVTLSRRLSKVMDEFQEDGAGVLKAFDSAGFHINSNWQGFRIKDASDALAVAVVARHNFKKRQTKEKNLREPYIDPISASENYSEIRTESETATDKFKDFVKEALEITGYKDFTDFAKKHSINTDSEAFNIKLQKIETALDRGGGRA